MTSPLFTPLSLRDLTLANRVVVAPMCQYSAEQGNATDWHLMHLGALTQGGPGLVIIEATAVSAAGRITPGCLGLWNADNEAALKRVLDALRPHSRSHIGIQLGHAGRKASSAVPWAGGQQLGPDQGGWDCLAPSALPHGPQDIPPRAMAQTDIDQLVADFVAAAQRADRLGLDAIELHCAHGYLLHSFLSPLSNQRSDAYGGTLENRMRLPLQVFDAVRAVWPAHKPLGVRVSATDWLEHSHPESGEGLDAPSWTLAQTQVLAQALKARGCDWIDVSSGGLSPQQRLNPVPGYQLPLAKAVREASGLTTIGVGLITSPQQAEAALVDGQADLVALARGILWNPHWVWQAALELGGHVQPPPQYSRSVPPGHSAVFRGVQIGAR